MFEKLKAALGIAVQGFEGVPAPQSSLSHNIPTGTFQGEISTAHIPGVWAESADLIHSQGGTVNARAVAQIFESADIRGVTRLATSAIVGNGLRLNLAPVNDLIGWTDAESARWSRRVEQLWNLWANSTEADAAGMLTFNEIQQQACMALFSHGEIIYALPSEKRVGDLFDTKVNLLPSERVSGVNADSAVKNGIKFINGRPAGLMIRDRDPVTDLTDWQDRYIPFRSKSGRPLGGIVIDATVPGQLRGVSILLGAIKPIFKAGRLSDAVLSAAQLQTLLALTITSNATSEEIAQLFSHGDSDQSLLDSFISAKLAWGKASGGLRGLPSATHLLPGEELKMTTTQQDAGNLDEFCAVLKREAAVAIGVPYSTLTSDYRNETYSSTRMSSAISHRLTLQRRATVAKFAQTVFSAWLEGAILTGRIEVPSGYMGFLSMRKAYERATWNGPAVASADPLKDARAMESRLSTGVSSLAWETEQLTGQDWQNVADQRAAEAAYIRSKGLSDPFTKEAGTPTSKQASITHSNPHGGTEALTFAEAVDRVAALEAEAAAMPHQPQRGQSEATSKVNRDRHNERRAYFSKEIEALEAQIEQHQKRAA